MLKQVLQQNASKAEAKSKQSQRQILSSRLLVLGQRMDSSIISSSYVSASARPADSPSPTQHHIDMMPLREAWAA